MFTYLLHGLRMRSEVPLHERAYRTEGEPDVSITVDRSYEDLVEPDGVVIAEFAPTGRALYQVFRQPTSYRLRVTGICDFVLPADGSRVVCRPAPGTATGWLEILLRGTVCGLLLDLGGNPTLHASAVEIGGRAIAFAGGSGAGKTTTAAMLCAAGARLVADDVLRIDFDRRGTPQCRLGSTELRLREAARHLLEDTSWIASSRTLVDGRLAVSPEQAPTDPVPLAAVVFPRPHRGLKRPEIRRVPPTEATVWLASAPRILWCDAPEALERAFVAAARVAEAVPVVEASIPWGLSPSATTASLTEVLAVAGV